LIPDIIILSSYLQANKKVACCRHKVVKFSGSVSLVFAAESAVEMAAEDVNNGKNNIDSAATSSTQTGDEHKKKRYISDDSVASMHGEKLKTFSI
jgi:hypothetical protein